MAGSCRGSRPKVFAKQPFSVPTTLPPANRPMKSSCTGWLLFCRVKVVVVLPVPDRPMISIVFSPDVGRDDLATGVHRQAAAPEDEGVPHPQAALLGLSEVVGVEDAADAGLQVNGDQALVRVVGHREVRGVDHAQLRVPVVGGRIGWEVELLLHAGDIGVGLLDVEADARTLLWIVAQVAVDHQHVDPGDVLRLTCRDPSALVTRDRPAGRLGRVIGHQVGRGGGSAGHLGLHVVVAEAGGARLRHPAGQLLQLLLRRVQTDRASCWQPTALWAHRRGAGVTLGERAHGREWSPLRRAASGREGDGVQREVARVSYQVETAETLSAPRASICT